MCARRSYSLATLGFYCIIVEHSGPRDYFHEPMAVVGFCAAINARAMVIIAAGTIYYCEPAVWAGENPGEALRPDTAGVRGQRSPTPMTMACVITRTHLRFVFTLCWYFTVTMGFFFLVPCRAGSWSTSKQHGRWGPSSWGSLRGPFLASATAGGGLPFSRPCHPVRWLAASCSSRSHLVGCSLMGESGRLRRCSGGWPSRTG